MAGQAPFMAYTATRDDQRKDDVHHTKEGERTCDSICNIR